MKILLLSVILCLTSEPNQVSGHARLMEPPSRSSMWRVGYPTKKNYDDDGLYCGGMQVQWHKNGGKCGICGDPWHMPHPRANEAGGVYGRGIITKHYKVGQVIEATVDVTTNHKGYFEFRLCPNNNTTKEASQQCLDKHLLYIVEGEGTKYYIADKGNGRISVHLQMPKRMSCTQCVLQWTYVAGNNWGRCEDGSGRLGCGPQETFRGCSDISVGVGKGYNGINKGALPPAAEENDIDNKPQDSEKSLSKTPAHSGSQTPLYPGFPAFPFQDTNYNGKKEFPNTFNAWNKNRFGTNVGNTNTFLSGPKLNLPNSFRKNLTQHLNGNRYFIWHSQFLGRNTTNSKGQSNVLSS